MANMIIRPAAGTGNKVIVQDQAGAAVLTTADAGAAIESNVTNNAGVATVTIASAVTFPAGHHLQTYWDSLSYSSNPSLDVTSEGDAMGSNLQVTITPKSTSNVLNVRCFIPDLYNHATNGRSLMSGFRYSTASNFSSSVQLGERQYPSSHELYTSAGAAMLGNLAYEVWIAPPNTSAIWIRPWLCSTDGNAFRIFANAGDGSGTGDRETAYLSVTEIQQ